MWVITFWATLIVLLECDAASLGTCFLTFWKSIVVSSKKYWYVICTTAKSYQVAYPKNELFLYKLWNLKEEEIMDALGNDGNTLMPEQVIWLNLWVAAAAVVVVEFVVM